MKIVRGSPNELGIAANQHEPSYIAMLAKKMKEFDPDASKALKLAEKYRMGEEKK